ncbi:TetR/AcrR family transcriptional regulator [Streptomyces sp. NPDC049577]|uniref:TetR/AcrR family transcriptional regulator n=1 Tax=Streptomyces sp. NPDC049577 TaxID=3155153 RepID=UPI003434387E
MARPRKFDEERAVDAALEAFWTAGYEATSTQDLCDATGLGRSSIYNTFKSKHDLFRRALHSYMERRTGELVELMQGGLPTREKIRVLLERVIAEESEHEEDGRGCLVVNAAVELAARDAEVASELARDYRHRLDALASAFERGRCQGDIDSAKDPAALAHFVIATIGGLRVSARAGADRAVLEGVARTALAAI